MGRKPTYDKSIVDEIFARVSKGETLSKICKEDQMPARTTVLLWVDQDSDIADKYARAKQAQLRYWADEVIEIADDSSGDIVMKTDRKGRQYEAVDYENIQRARLRVDSRKWLLSKLLPREYGERITQEHIGLKEPQIKITMPSNGREPKNNTDETD